MTSQHPEKKNPVSESAYPKWLILLAGVNILSLFLAPFYLFGGLAPASENGFVRFLFYILTNLIWLFPIATFFIALTIWGWGYRKSGIALILAGFLLMCFGVWQVWSHL